MSIKTELITEFRKRMDQTEDMSVESEEYKKSVEAISKIADRIIELDKIEQHDAENSVKWELQETENKLKTEQMAAEKKSRWIGHGIEVVKVIGGLSIPVWAFLVSMVYEDKGKLPMTEGGRAALKSMLKFGLFNNK